MRFLATLRQVVLSVIHYSVLIVMLISIAACGGNQPIPTAIVVTATPSDTAIPVADVQFTQPAVATRTPLPSLTPSATTNAPAIPTTDPQATQPITSQPIATTAVAATSVATTVSTSTGPTSTSALLSITVTAAFTSVPVDIQPGVPPALDITLPQGWTSTYLLVPIRQPLTQVTVNLARYYGPVKNGGFGTIFVLWNFPSIGAAPTIAPPGPTATYAPNVTPLTYQQQLLWSDGVRLLKGTIAEITCNTANHDQRFFQIGKETGIGAYFNVSQCPHEQDTVGWFAGLHQQGINYLFYTFIEPVEAYSESRADLQRILDTVIFKAPVPAGTTTSVTSTPPPTNTP